MPREYFPATTDSIADLNELNAAFHDAASPSKYPKTLSKQERNTAAANIRAALKGKTGQKRAEVRAEQMDPGPGDESYDAENSRDDVYEGKEAKAIAGESKSRGSTAFNFGANETQKTRTQRGLATPKLVKTRTPRNYASQERKAIQGEAKSKGSTAFPFGANKA
jgi:hypothetical protein